ncbi:MAG: DUF305 domain-containing protein [Actinobacteria bacterium]|nr:DUF305 domain-containing protein [Actinomycetota bacterium]
MQINIDKKSGIFITIIAALLLIIAAISFNSRDDGSINKSAMNGSDEMFLQMMIPHHEQAVEMSNLALAKSKTQKFSNLLSK